MTMLVQLNGLGPFVTPKVVDYLGLAYPLARETLEIRFVLEDGQEIRLPIHRFVFDELLDFAAAHSKKTAGLKARRIRILMSNSVTTMVH